MKLTGGKESESRFQQSAGIFDTKPEEPDQNIQLEICTDHPNKWMKKCRYNRSSTLWYFLDQIARYRKIYPIENQAEYFQDR